jgi:glycosyltransferase involved in cell wall biosynthesis/protein-L-isoaspartate O-methyltransferase
MKVSFLMPVYNKEAYVAEAIMSFVNQSHRDRELIIIDDASTDGTKQVCEFMASKHKNIHYYENLKNMGVAYSRNLARQFASGDIICVLDADDIAYIQRASIVNKFFTINKDIDIMYGAVHIIDISGNVKGTKSPTDFSIIKAKETNEITHSSVAFRKSVDISYRKDANFIDDWYFYLDCYSAGYKFGKVDIIIGAYRMEPDGLTYQGGMMKKSKEKLKDALRKEFKDFEQDLTDIMKKSSPQKERIRLILKDVPSTISVENDCCTVTENMLQLFYEKYKNMFMLQKESTDKKIEILQSLSCKLYEILEKIAPVDEYTKNKGQLQKLCESLFEKRKVDKKILRDLFQSKVPDAPCGLHKTTTSKMALPRTPLATSHQTKVLDVGCNGGYIMSSLLKKDCSVIGIEKAENLIKICQLKGLDVRNIDIFDTEQLNALGLFDRIILGDILEHYKKDLTYKLVANFLNMLTKNGKLIITVPYKYGNYSTKFTSAHVDNYSSENFRKLLPSKEIKSMPICVDDYAVPYWEKVVISK